MFEPKTTPPGNIKQTHMHELFVGGIRVREKKKEEEAKVVCVYCTFLVGCLLSLLSVCI
jgi:hypothetical protein